MSEVLYKGDSINLSFEVRYPSPIKTVELKIEKGTDTFSHECLIKDSIVSALYKSNDIGLHTAWFKCLFEDNSIRSYPIDFMVVEKETGAEKLEKAQKVYLSPGQKAPEESPVKQGKRGGKYYESQERQSGQQEQSQQQLGAGIPNVSPQSETDFSKVPLNEKAIRAKASYKPATKEVQKMADDKEIEISQVLQGQRTSDNAPFDVIKGNIAIEIKTIVNGENPKITMHPDAKKRKEEFSVLHNLTSFTIVFHQPSNSIYYRKGIGSFRLDNMEKVSYKQLVDKIV